MPNRVFLTGLGPLCSLSDNIGGLWATLLSGESGITRPPRLSHAVVDIGAAVPDVVAGLGPRERRLDRAAQLALRASEIALAHAGVEGGGDGGGVVLGSSRGAAERLEYWHGRYLEAGTEAV